MKKVNQTNYYKDIITALLELKQHYPSYTMGKHIATILDDYQDVWGLTDREFLYALTKYTATMEMDVPHETDERELQRIIDDGMDLRLPSDEDFDNTYYPD